jgi:cyclophilin family peptidyl-prolyl cis-trans isomerase
MRGYNSADDRGVERDRRLRNGAIVAALVLAVLGVLLAVTNGFSGSGKGTTASTSTTTTAVDPHKLQVTADKIAHQRNCPTSASARVNTLTWPAPPPISVTPAKTYTASIATTLGGFIVSLDAQHAPQAVSSFIYLAGQQFFTCDPFFLAEPTRFVATGDPTGAGSGGPGYTIPPENVPTSYQAGDLVMLKSAAGTSGSQFAVVVSKQPLSLPAGSTVFGKVTSGLDVLQEIAALGNATPSKNGRTPRVLHRLLVVNIHAS